MAQFTPVSSKWLPENHRFALGWKGDRDIEYTFHRVLGRQFNRFRPFQNNINAISSLGNQQSVLLKDSQSNDILQVSQENASKIIKHVGIGIGPDNVRVYYRYPDGVSLPKVDNTSPTNVGNDKGFLTGFDSPYGEPTDAMEFFFPYSITASFNFYNPVSFDKLASGIWPKLNIEIMQYRVEQLSPSDPFDGQLISAMARGQAQVRLFTIGPPDSPTEYPGSLTSLWNVQPITLRAARRLGGGN